MKSETNMSGLTTGKSDPHQDPLIWSLDDPLVECCSTCSSQWRGWVEDQTQVEHISYSLVYNFPLMKIGRMELVPKILRTSIDMKTEEIPESKVEDKRNLGGRDPASPKIAIYPTRADKPKYAHKPSNCPLLFPAYKNIMQTQRCKDNTYTQIYLLTTNTCTVETIIEIDNCALFYL